MNGVDFQEISHKDAVRILKAYKMMSMLLRHLGKIPYAKTILEKTEWLDSARTSRYTNVILFIFISFDSLSCLKLPVFTFDLVCFLWLLLI